MSIHRLLILYCIVLLAIPAAGQTYSLNDTVRYHAMRGTYYADRFVGRKTASGDVFNHYSFTCANKNIPLNTYIEVVNPKNGKRVFLHVNDRCPRPGIVDMTRAALASLGIKGAGSVSVRILGPGETARILADGTYSAQVCDDSIAGVISMAVASKDVRRKDDSRGDSAPSKVASAPSKPKPQSDKPVSSKQPEKKRQKTSTAAPRYDIMLCEERDIKKVERYATLVPPEYEDVMSFCTIKQGRTALVLRLNMIENKITPILAELMETFPRAQLTLHK